MLILVSVMLFQIFQSDSQPRAEVARQEVAYFGRGGMISVEWAYTKNNARVT